MLSHFRCLLKDDEILFLHLQPPVGELVDYVNSQSISLIPYYILECAAVVVVFAPFFFFFLIL